MLLHSHLNILYFIVQYLGFSQPAIRVNSAWPSYELVQWIPMNVGRNRHTALYSYPISVVLLCQLVPDWERRRFYIDNEVLCEDAYPCYRLSRRGLNPIKLSYNPVLVRQLAQLTASTFNRLDQYAGSPGNKAYCYAELAWLLVTWNVDWCFMWPCCMEAVCFASAVQMFVWSSVLRFGRRVSRAFSQSKTPRSMKRAISSVTHIMSPMRRESSVCGLPSIAQTTPRGIAWPPSNLSSLDGSDIDITVCMNFLLNQMEWILCCCQCKSFVTF